MEQFALGLASGLSYGMVLFLIAIGLSMTWGLMGIINLSHGTVFMVGGYVSLTVVKLTDNFILGLLAGTVAAGIVGLIIERTTISRLYKQFLDQILVTYGFVYIISNATLWVWGSHAKPPYVPKLLSGAIPIGDLNLPVHRLAIIVIGLLLAGALWWLQERTKFGAIVRAGMDDAEMTGGLGINLTPVIIIAFFFGSMVAGFGGAIGLPVLGGVYTWLGIDILWVAIVVCIVGGMGSTQGALGGALIIGIIDTFGKMYFPQLAMFTSYLVAIVILLVRPRGLLGRKV
jgi:branched-chain amino acid transport system permease protein